MRKEREEAVRRTGRIGVQLAALGIAFSVFGVSAVFGANALDSAAVLTAADPYEGITQDGELGIAQLSSEENGFFSDSSAELPPDESEMESSDANSESSAGESEPIRRVLSVVKSCRIFGAGLVLQPRPVSGVCCFIKAVRFLKACLLCGGLFFAFFLKLKSG